MGKVSGETGSGAEGDMTINPRVTIITVYYNRRDNVRESIESLLNQTYHNLEIIIVDDCSTDDTFEKISNTVKLDTRVKLIRNEQNKGFTQTLIDTIKEIDTEYIAIHGAGDISLPTRVEIQTDHLVKNPDVGVVTTDITNIKKPKFHKTVITLNDLLKKNRITHGAVMFRKSVYDQVGGYRSFFTARQDKDLWFRMSLVTKIHFIDKKLYTIIKIKYSVSQSSSKNIIPTYLSIFAIQLILERVDKNIDSLDVYGCNAGLLFKPQKAKSLFLKKAYNNLIRLKLSKALNYLIFAKNSI